MIFAHIWILSRNSLVMNGEYNLFSIRCIFDAKVECLFSSSSFLKRPSSVFILIYPKPCNICFSLFLFVCLYLPSYSSVLSFPIASLLFLFSFLYYSSFSPIPNNIHLTHFLSGCQSNSSLIVPSFFSLEHFKH